jgi:hypothetical protein
MVYIEIFGNPIIRNYLLMLCIGFLFFFWLLKGFIVPYLRARFSFGKLLMIKIRTLTVPRYVVGELVDNSLRFKLPKYLMVKGDKNNVRMITNVSRESIYRDLGVSWIELDMQTWAILTPKMEGVPSSDLDVQSSLYVRCLYRPSLLEDKTKMMLIILFVCCGLCLVSAIVSYQNLAKINKLGVAIYEVRGYILNNATNILR